MQKTINIVGEHIIYRDFGTGPVLLLLHGYGGHPSHWNHVADELSKTHRILIPSLSSVYLNRMRRFTFTEMVAMLAAFVDEVVPQGTPISIAGASYGGTLAWALACELKERVNSITLLSPMPPDPVGRVRNNLLRAAVKLSQVPFALRIFFVTPVARRVLPRIEDVFIGHEQRARRKGRFEMLNSRKLALIIHILDRFRWIAVRENWSDWRRRFQKLEKPICIIWGSWDRLFERDIPEELSKLAPNCQLFVIEKAGHLPMKENPEAVLKIMKLFMKKKPPVRDAA